MISWRKQGEQRRRCHHFPFCAKLHAWFEICPNRRVLLGITLPASPVKCTCILCHVFCFLGNAHLWNPFDMPQLPIQKGTCSKHEKRRSSILQSLTLQRKTSASWTKTGRSETVSTRTAMMISCQATEVPDSDVTLWFQNGSTCAACYLSLRFLAQLFYLQWTTHTKRLLQALVQINFVSVPSTTHTESQNIYQFSRSPQGSCPEGWHNVNELRKSTLWE